MIYRGGSGECNIYACIWRRLEYRYTIVMEASTHCTNWDIHMGVLVLH